MNIVVKRAVLMPGPTGEGQWRIEVETTDGGRTERGLAIAPADAIEWRMAQFNVDAPTAAKLLVTRRHTGVKDNVYDDQPSRSAARDLAIAHMNRVGTVTWGAAKAVGSVVAPKPPEPAAGSIADSRDGDPLATLVTHSPVNEAHIAVKREWLDLKRAERRHRMTAEKAESTMQAAAAPAPALVRPDAESLRERLITSRRIKPEASSSGPADVRTKETHWKQ